MSGPSAPGGWKPPAHPESDDTGALRDQASETNWATVLVLGFIGALVLAILVLHLSGVVGPAAHR